MTAENFCYWLQGLFEIANPAFLTSDQTVLIREHLSLAFKHDIDKRYPKEEQAALRDAHDGSRSKRAKPGSDGSGLQAMC